MTFINKVKSVFKSTKSFKDLDDLIHSGSKEIILESDFVLRDAEEFNYLDGISLDVDGIIIDGNGHSIDGERKTRIFNCTAKNVTLKNIVFKNGHSTDSGGAILNTGELTLARGIFITNTSIFDGGAIENRGILNISESTFKSNFARKAAGAIFNLGGEITIKKSAFAENATVVMGHGGAIYSFGSLNISESSFLANRSEYGGAILANEGDVTIADSTFADNDAEYGGAIYNDGAKLEITKSILKGNVAMYDGGAVQNCGDLTIADSTLAENTAKNRGGIVCSVNPDYTLDNCTCKDNVPDDVFCNVYL